MKPSTVQPTLDLESAEAYVGLHPDTLAERARAGIIPGAKPGRRWRFLEGDLAAYLRSCYRCRSTKGADRKSGTSTSGVPAGDEFDARLAREIASRRSSSTTSSPRVPALREVTAESVADAFGDLSAPTYNRLVTVLRAALNLAAGRGWMPGAVRIARRKVRERSVRWLTPDEWMRLRAHLALHVRPLADFALATGLRWGNVARLTWAQVDLAGRRCWIDAASAKGGRAIAVPLSAAAMALLEAQASGRADLAGPVFTYRAG